MDRRTKEKAVSLLRQKAADPSITYADVALETGYSERQLMRLAKRLAEGGEGAALAHGNSGRRAANAATDDEVRYMRGLKGPYPSITIAHFRDIYIEDVLQNPAKAGDVERYGLVPRSASWFRLLFEREGWESPAARRPRRGGDGRPHPMRPPLPRAGMMVQVDGTPYDWFGSGEAWCMHLGVDDATTSVLGGWFMPVECMRGYSRMMHQVVTRHGVPQSMYSDKDSVLRSVKSGGPTQFSAMMADLGIRMIYANSPQAKGRVERYNRTAQLRLSNDLVRFGVSGYDAINAWFNDFYAPYLNSKFSYRPRDPASAFSPLPEGLDLARVFRTRDTRVAKSGVISWGASLYMVVDSDGVILESESPTTVNVHVDAITEELYAELRGRRYALVEFASRDRRGPAGAYDQRDLQRILKGMSGENAVREG